MQDENYDTVCVFVLQWFLWFVFLFLIDLCDILYIYLSEDGEYMVCNSTCIA